jgi:hypothetical protein
MLLTLLTSLMLIAAPAMQMHETEPSIQNLLNDAERRTLARAANIQSKTQALLTVSKRFLTEADKMQKADQSQGMLDSLKSYQQIMRHCEWQIHSQPSTAKRQSYKKQEIELRRQIKSLDDLLAKSDYEDKSAIQEVINTASMLRTHFLATFFGKDSLKKP